MADAPSVAVNRVATYKELDSDLLKNVAFATLDDIDLRKDQNEIPTASTDRIMILALI